MTPVALGVRILIIIAWLGLIGWHAVRYTFPDWGLARTFDPGATLAANLDRTFRYEIRRSAVGKPFAECSLTLMQDEARYRSTTTITVKDLGAVQGLDTMLKLLFNQRVTRQSSLRATLTQVLDARFRMVEAEASGEGLGMTFTANGTVDARGLHGRYRVGDGAWTPVEMPAISPDLAQGSDMALTLPPRLKPGDAFSTRMVHFDPIQMNARPAVGVFNVQQAEVITVAKLAVPCMRVVLTVDNRPSATMWADQEGVVFRLNQIGSGMIMDLAAITKVTGGAIWPRPVTSPAPTTTP